MCSFTSFDIFAAAQTNCYDAKLTGNEVTSKDAKATGFVELNLIIAVTVLAMKSKTNIEKATSVDIH